MSSDYLQRFSFDGTDVRGEITHLNESYQEVIRRHKYPQLVATHLGELMAATAILSATLKFAGRITLQARLEGNIRLLQAETNEKGQLRAIARYDETTDNHELIFENGQLIITLEPEQGQRYQGITAISGGNIAAALEEYFAQSEQLPSLFWLTADGKNAAGLMIQKIPTPAEEIADEDAWDRIHQLSATVKDEELLGLPADVLLHRLFHEENTRVFPSTELGFYCSCSKPRIATALTQLGYDELNALLEEQKRISINCEFCQQHYSFDRKEVESLFPERHPHQHCVCKACKQKFRPNTSAFQKRVFSIWSNSATIRRLYISACWQVYFQAWVHAPLRGTLGAPI